LREKRWLSGFVLAGILLAAGTGRSEVVGSLYNPADYTTGPGFNTHLNLHSNDTLTVYTGTSEANPWYSLDGGTNKYYGQKVSNQNNKVQLAVFCFDRVTINGATIDITGGNLGLVLGSRSGFMFSNSTIDVSGSAGASGANAGGAGGPGAEGGTSMAAGFGTYASNPPDNRRGYGGLTTYWHGTPEQPKHGYGYGGGEWRNDDDDGAGGGYGGLGGELPGLSGYRGHSYGDALLKNLYGGSGGARAMQTGGRYGSGGGGGGSVSLIALGNLVISGSILANGKTGGRHSSNGTKGGSGSGGGVLVAAQQVTLQSGASISAVGGDSSDGSGCGGGGRVVVHTGVFMPTWPNDQADWSGSNARTMTVEQLNELAGLTVDGAVNPVNVSRGTGGSLGAHGTFYVLDYYVPPGGTLLMLQ